MAMGNNEMNSYKNALPANAETIGCQNRRQSHVSYRHADGQSRCSVVESSVKVATVCGGFMGS